MHKDLFLIIEGADRMGKSTLITNIKNHYNNYTLHQLHYSNVKQSTPEKTIQYSTKLYIEMFELIQEISEQHKNSGVICDRSHIGEMIYGPLYRGYSGKYVLSIESLFHGFDFWNDLILITLIDKAENVIKRDDGLSFSTDLEKKKNEISKFKLAHIESTIQNKLLLDISEHNENQAIQAVVEFINTIY